MTAPVLLGIAVVYLAALYVLASLVDRSRGRARAWARHPWTSALSLGVYATSWTYFGSVGVAASAGYQFLAIYIGATISCALIPVLWQPIARLCSERRLASVADLLAFRYQSRAVGVLVTLLFLAGSLPYQALQMRATVVLVSRLTGAPAPASVALVFTVLLVGFATTYGVRHVTPLERHDGFVAAVAVESLVKLVALLAVAGFALYGVWGGLSGFTHWLAAHPEAHGELATPARERSWTAVLVVSAASFFLLPRQWHMGFTEGSPRGLQTASWLLPLYLLLLNLTVPIVLWSGQSLGLAGAPEFYLLELVRASGSGALSALVFLGALSASGAMIVVSTVALASMLQNQLVLPFIGLARGDLYTRLRWLRRGLATAIIVAGHGVYLLLAGNPRLADLGLSSFLAVAQALPGVLGVLFFPAISARGVAFGLCAGALGWLGTSVLPLLADAETLPARFNWLVSLGVADDALGFATAVSLGANVFAVVLGSLARAPNAAEERAAAVCRDRDALHEPEGGRVATPRELEGELSLVLGDGAAAREMEAAIGQLAITRDERRPHALRALRERLETNLSGLLGPVTARMIVDEQLSSYEPMRMLLSAQLRYAEERHSALSGPERSLQEARQFLRDLFDELPVGVCVLGPAGDVALWNRAIARVTALSAAAVIGSELSSITSAWTAALTAFADSAESRAELAIDVHGQTFSIALHRAAVASPMAQGGLVIVLEDRSEERALRNQLMHQERLASIGRFAAGVAHEIGNPLTGITSLAQNLRADSSDDDARERLALLIDQARRIERIVRSLIGFARAEPSGVSRTPVDLAELVPDAVTLARFGREHRAVDVHTTLAPDLTLRADRQGVEQVLVNLLTNAVYASPPGAVVSLTAERIADGVRIRIEDRGAGMSEQVRARIFEPFFTTKPPGEGSGLGLSLAYGIVTEHGGTISIDSAEGRGTRVTLELPA